MRTVNRFEMDNGHNKQPLTKYSGAWVSSQRSLRHEYDIEEIYATFRTHPYFSTGGTSVR
jgi:hypothetical protein